MSGVLITRPAAQAAATAMRLKAAGYATFVAPLLEIEPLDWQAPDITPQAVLVTSQNAVPALAASALARTLSVYAVGDATAQQVRAAGFGAVESAAGDAAALLALVRQRCVPGAGALLYLAGEVLAGTLPADLAAEGYWVELRVVYRALAASALPPAVQQALEAGQIATVLLYSPRSAAVFARLLGGGALRQRLHLLCLSAAVAQAAGTGWARVTISPQPDENSLLEKLLTTAKMV